MTAMLRAAFALILISASSTAQGDDELRPRAFEPLPLGSIEPTGWLKDQLKIQADGLSGHLDEFWPDIKDSAWLGGKAEGWERAPYWLDGIVPLAYLLNDDGLKAKAQRFIDYVLAHQHEDGWMGPVSDGKHEAYDPWPLFVLFKAFTQYQEATGDPRIIPALLKCAKKIDEVTDNKPLFSWGHFRAADFIVSLDWLYEKTGEKWLLGLAEKIHKQGFDWRKLFEEFPFKEKVSKFDLSNHGVNVGMSLKAPGVWSRHSGDPKDRDFIFGMLDTLDRHHGQATGIFTCDEHLAGRSPVQGTELCTVVEAMYSLEVLNSIVGDPRLGDRLERLAFNALPATFKPDMCAHQYDQQANQVVCKLAPDRVYTNNGPDANLYGLEPNFGCCTANMHQGWPKFAANLWMKTPDGGLAAMAYAPCMAATKIDGKMVWVEVKTSYPFGDDLTINVQPEEPLKFPLLLRVPGWAEGAYVTVELAGSPGFPTQATETEYAKSAGSLHRIERLWNKGWSTVTLHLPRSVRLWKGQRDAVAIERGPLVFALQIGESWKRLKGNPPFADWEVFPTTPWNYALQIDRTFPEESVQFTTQAVGRRPFSPEGAPIRATVKGRLVPWWTIEKNAAGPVPEGPVESDQPHQDLTLIPYGCTNLRVTEFPVLAPKEPGR